MTILTVGQAIMEMSGIGKMLIISGAILIVSGIILVLLQKFFSIRGLPGDIILKRGNYSIYFPIVTSIILSIILTLLLNIILRNR